MGKRPSSFARLISPTSSPSSTALRGMGRAFGNGAAWRSSASRTSTTTTVWSLAKTLRSPSGSICVMPPKRPPHRDAELVAPDFGITPGHELRRRTLALAAVRAVAVEHDRGVLALVHQAIDLRHVRDVHRHRNAGLGGHVDGAGNVADRILACRTCVEHEGALVREDVAQLFS